MSLFPEMEARERQEYEAALIDLAATTARLREREADFTPRLVARAIIEWLLRGEVQHSSAISVITGPRYTIWPAIARVADPEWLGGDSHDEGGPVIAIPHEGRRRVIRVLDICAGAGVWSSEIRRLAARMGFDVHITAVDYEPDERQWLVRHADRVIIGDWHVGLGMVQDKLGAWAWGEERETYDLILGNPAFSQARAATRAGWPTGSGPLGKNGKPTVTKAEAEIRKRMTDAVIAAGDYGERAECDTLNSMPKLCLQCAPVVALYATQQCYTKTASGWLTWLDYPGAVALNVPSSIGHRGRGEGQDDKPYTMFVWTRWHDRTEPTATFMLDPIEDRNWDVRPGTESDEWLAANDCPFIRVAA